MQLTSKDCISIGLLGCGNIGSGVFELIQHNFQDIQNKVGKCLNIKRVLVKNPEKHLNKPYTDKLTQYFEEVIKDEDISIVVEVMGGIDPAYRYVKEALLTGKHVVTANKELIAECGEELERIAKGREVNLMFEASVGGGIPIIRPLHQCLAANKIHEITGIINGTTNYILSQMYNNNKSYQDALKEAQEKGYAEQNPEADVEGYDAGRKLAILATIAFNRVVRYEDIQVEGITRITREDIQYANKLGYVIKLLATAVRSDNKMVAKVAPTMLPLKHSLARVENVFNAILVKGDAVGEVLFYGQGAGKMPTASAVVADIMDIVKRSIVSIPNKVMQEAPSPVPLSIDWSLLKGKYFIRLKPKDRHIAMGKISEKLRECEFVFLGNNCSMYKGECLGIVTGMETQESLIEKIEYIKRLDCIYSVDNVIRIEEAQ